MQQSQKEDVASFCRTRREACRFSVWRQRTPGCDKSSFGTAAVRYRCGISETQSLFQLGALAVTKLATTRKAVAELENDWNISQLSGNSLEGLVVAIAGATGSISLVGFGIDSHRSHIRCYATVANVVDAIRGRKERATEYPNCRRVSLPCRHIVYEAITDLYGRKALYSIPGIVPACVSLIVMPILSCAKKKVCRISVAQQWMPTRSRLTSRVYLSRFCLDFC